MALSASPHGFTASDLARQVRALSQQRESEYGARRAAYDLKKLRGKKIVRRMIRRADMNRCRKDGERSSRWWFSETKPSHPCSPPHWTYGPRAARRIPER